MGMCLSGVSSIETEIDLLVLDRYYNQRSTSAEC